MTMMILKYKPVKIPGNVQSVGSTIKKKKNTAAASIR